MRTTMRKILTAAQMRKYDEYTIKNVGIPSLVLMERAALGVYAEIVKYIADTNMKPEKTKVLVLCGTGNNGGDGLAIARLLFCDGIKPDVVLLGDNNKLSQECATQLQILENIGLSVGAQMKDDEYDIIIDALWGIGLHRTVCGAYEQILTKVNHMQGYKIAVDIPSGIEADHGYVLGVAIKADLTVTFGYCKRGMFLGEGPTYCGKVVVKDIGIAKLDLEKVTEQVWAYDEQPFALLPARDPKGNKGTFGKLYIYAGCEETLGAAILCAKSAFSAGVGMVKVLCPRKFQSLFLEHIPEVMLTLYDSEEPMELLEIKIKADLEWADAVATGPGIGLNKIPSFILQYLIRYAKVPMVLDADALNLLSKDESLRKELIAYNQKYNRKVVLTPHIVEMSRLLHLSVKEIKDTPLESALLLSERYDCIAVCKDAKTIVCQKEDKMYLNLSGNHGMATAGSGDVLTGILGAYLALQVNLYEYTSIGVYLHGKAGEHSADKVGARALMASHIIEGMIELQKGN